MARATTFVLFICVFLLSSLPLLADSISEVRTLYDKINKAISEKKTTEVLLYTTPDGYAEKRWIKVKQTDSATSFDNSYFKAKVFVLHNKVVKAVIDIESQAGDWINSREYYFYENGKTAFLFESHLTHLGYNLDQNKSLPPGPYVIEKRIYLNKTGKEIRSLQKAFIASTKEEIPAKYLQKIDIEVYRDIASLPFSKELNR